MLDRYRIFSCSRTGCCSISWYSYQTKRKRISTCVHFLVFFSGELLGSYFFLLREMGKAHGKKRQGPNLTESSGKPEQKTTTTENGSSDFMDLSNTGRATPDLPEEIVDDTFDGGFDLFKPGTGSYLEDTWGDVSRQRFKKQEKPEENTPKSAKLAADRLRTKERKAPKVKKSTKIEIASGGEDVAVKESEQLDEDGPKDVTDSSTTFQVFFSLFYSLRCCKLFQNIFFINCYVYLSSFFRSIVGNEFIAAHLKGAVWAEFHDSHADSGIGHPRRLIRPRYLCMLKNRNRCVYWPEELFTRKFLLVFEVIFLTDDSVDRLIDWSTGSFTVCWINDWLIDWLIEWAMD